MSAMSLRHRQLLALALTANALRPLRQVGAGIPAFVAGWTTSELAPQLLTATALDAAAEVTLRRRRRGHPDRTGLALAALTAAGAGPAAAALPYVAIDAGHGGADTGAVGGLPPGTVTGLTPRADDQGRTVLYEKDVNLDIAVRLQAVLTSLGARYHRVYRAAEGTGGGS